MNHSSSTTGFVTDDRSLRRMVLLMLLAFILVTVAFAAYYYWDRYVHLGDETPLERGAAHLEQLVGENPANPDARLALGEYYIQSEDFAGAMEQAQAVLKAYPDHAGALLVLGVATTLAGDAQAAVDPLESFAAQRRDEPMAGLDTNLEAALYYLGVNFVSLNQPEKAIAVLSEALTIEPTDADAMYKLGTAHALLGMHPEAIAQYHEAVRFVPEFIEAYQAMAASYEALGQLAEAEYARGMEAFSMRAYDQARQSLEEAAVALPEFVPLHLGLGLTYEQLGEAALARTHLHEALSLDPENFYAAIVLDRIPAPQDNP